MENKKRNLFFKGDQRLQFIFVQRMAGALLAIFGQNSAHSLATGPVTTDPFISPLGFTITPALSFVFKRIVSINFDSCK